MRWTLPAAALTTALLMAGCATVPPPPPPPPPPPEDGAELLPDWQAAIQEYDRDRLARFDEAWATALEQAMRDGHEARLRGLGALADMDTSLRNPLPPEGRYRCRTIKLGARQGGPGLSYVAYGWFNCVVERTSRGGWKLSKTTGSQRQTGLMFPDSERRGVFLGAMALGNEPPARAYGLNRDRDVVGVIERIGPARWRLSQPWPRYESNLDILEIVPAG